MHHSLCTARGWIASNRRVVCRVGLWRQFSAPPVTCYRNRRECEWCNRCCYWKIKYAAIQKSRKKAVLWSEWDLTSFKLCKNQIKPKVASTSLREARNFWRCVPKQDIHTSLTSSTTTPTTTPTTEDRVGVAERRGIIG